MSQGTGRNRPRRTYTTRSGRKVAVTQSYSEKKAARKAEKAAERALYLSSLPKTRAKRLLYRLKPAHIFHYWFSRQGALTALKVLGIAIAAGFFLVIGVFAYYRKDLPPLKDISGGNIGGTVSFYDRTGKVLLWQDNNGVKRIPVSTNQISPYMKEATVAIEDRNFYREGAFNVRGIIRAAVNDLFTHGSLQGGSTITQQLVKLNEGWTDRMTITRKIKELILAVEVEREYSKSQILTGYLNIAPYGGIDYGVEAAAEDYFREPASKLTLAQASMLAAIPQSPSYYSPYASTRWNPEAGNTFSKTALLGRQHYILQQMVTQHYITNAQAQQAANVNVLAQIQQEQGLYTNIKDPYFVLVAKQQLISKFGSQLVAHGGLKVITTLSTQLQNYANQDIANNIANVARTGGDDEAMVGENVKTGQVVMLVGGENFNNPVDGQLNFANLNILPGSSVKPFVYSTLIENNTNVGAGSVLYDVKQPIKAGGVDYYPCTNTLLPLNGGNCLEDYDFRYPGPESIRYALAGSRNVPAIKAVLSEDPTDTSPGHVDSINLYIKTFERMMYAKNSFNCYKAHTRILSPTPGDVTQCYAAAGIGDGAYDHIDNQVNGDASLGRMGVAIPQSYILNVTSASGKVLYQWHQPKGIQVIKPDTAYIINNILSDPNATYLPGSYKFQHWKGWDIAVKTGTQADNFDGLMTAWTTQYAVVSWAGNHLENVPLAEGQMEAITEPLTRGWIEQALGSLHMKPVNWTQPPGIKVLPGFVQRTHVGLGSVEPGPTKDLFPSWYIGKGSTTTTQTIDKVSGYLATSCTPALAKETVSGANVNSFSADIFYPNYVANEQALEGTSAANASTQTDNIHQCGDSRPSVSVTVTSNAANGQNNVCDSNSQGCTITIDASAGTYPLTGGNYRTYPAGTVNVDVNGNSIKSITIPSNDRQNFSYSFNYSPSSTASGTITATVVDSVLYSSSNSQSVQLTSSLGGFKADKTNGSVAFSWAGGSPPYTLSVNGNSLTNCTNVTATSCTFNGSLPAGDVTLTDNNGNRVKISSP